MKTFKSKDNRFCVTLQKEQLDLMLSMCKKSKRHETGGVLAGTYTDKNRNVLITHIGRPPLDSEFGLTWFVRGVKGIQDWLNNLWKNKTGYYVGEWHYHPFSSSSPSSQDLKQLKSISQSNEYNCPEPVLVIVGGDPKKDWTLSATIVKSDGEVLFLSEVN